MFITEAVVSGADAEMFLIFFPPHICKSDGQNIKNISQYDAVSSFSK